MAQHDYIIANGTGAAVRSDLNNALAAIVSQNSGATAPSPTYAYQFWADTTTGLLKLRNAANSAWITLFQLDGEWSTLPVENGTAAAPSIYFKDSGTDTGFYSPGTDQIGISTGGTARLTIDANGNVAVDTNTLYVDAPNNRVGIGSSNPSSLLHVGSGATGVTQATLQGGSVAGDYGIFAIQNGSTVRGRLVGDASVDALRIDTGGGASTKIQFYTGSSYTNAVTIDSSQRVGIGTTPDSRLHVSDASGNALRIGYTSGGNFNIYDANIHIFRSSNATTDYGRFDASGRLLVGTSSSINNVYVGGASYQSPFQVIGNAAGYGNGLTSLNYSSGGYGATLTLGSSKNATVGVNGALANADDLGIINFVGNDGTNFRTGAYIIATVDGTPSTADLPTRLSFWTAADGTVAPTERMRITNGGITSTFTTAGNASLWVANGSAAGTSVQLIYGTHSAGGVIGGTNSFTVWTNGNVQNTNGSYTTLSDAKLKENIVDAGSQWDDVKAVRIRKWNFKAETGHETHRQIGPIAQELETVCPGLVFETPDRDADGNETGEVTKGVNQSVLYMKAVKALQEAMERIEQLEAKVAALESA